LPDVLELCKHLIEPGLRHHDHTVLVGDHHIAAAHRMAGKCHRKSHGARTAAVRGIRSDPHAVGRKTHPADSRKVAYTPIGYKTDRPAVAGHPQQQITGDGAGGVSMRSSHDHVAGLNGCKGMNQGQIIGRAGVAGQRNAAKLRKLRNDRLDTVIECAGSAQRINHKTGGSALKQADLVASGSVERLMADAWQFLDHCLSCA